MIDVMARGRLMSAHESGLEVSGRIVLDGDILVQIAARRGAVKRQLLALPQGHPIAVAGVLTTKVMVNKVGEPYVRHDIDVTAILTPGAEAPPEPRTGILRAMLKGTQ